MTTNTTIRVRIQGKDGEVRHDQHIWFFGTEEEIKNAAFGMLKGAEIIHKKGWSTLFINGEVVYDCPF